MATLELKPSYFWSGGVLWPIAGTTVVVARLVTRRAKNVRYGWDDWVVVPAWGILCGLSAIMLTGVAKKVMGYPTPPINPKLFLTTNNPDLDLVRELYWIAFLISIPALTCIKLSAALFYRRIFRTGQSKTVDVILYALMGIILLWGVAFTITTIFSCGNPKRLDYFWTALENQSKCSVNPSIWQKGLTISDVIIDILLLLYPLPHIWRLNMSTARKIGTSIVFLFGSLSTAASVVRLVDLLQSLELEFQSRINPNFLTAEGVYFIVLEVGFGLIAVCLPTLAGTLHLPAAQRLLESVSIRLSLLRSTGRSDRSDRVAESSGSEKRSQNIAYLPSKGHALDTNSTSIASWADGSERMDEESGVVVSRSVKLTHQEV